MNNQFILNYTGSKYKETKELDNINFDKYDVIIECFGGSYGFSRYLYKNKNFKNKKYIIYDNNKDLIDFYLYIQDSIKNDTFNDFIKVYNDECEYLVEHFRYKDDKKRLQGTLAKKYIIKLENKYLKLMLLHNCVRGSFIDSNPRYKLDKDFIEMFNNISFIYSDIINIDFNIYNKEKTLIYLDPPYLLENNSFYNDISNMKVFYEKIMYLFENNKVLFIHSYNYLLDYVFEKYKYMEYKKKYGMSKKNVNHIVYYND
tara:strand:+ start:3502 stop:4275 length:774 start_codon:yes stop_codon:yes gene_type:complete